MSKHIGIENKQDLLLKHLNDHYTLFIRDGVLGITLNGGLARGFADDLSEVDITIYLSDEAFESYSKGLLRIHSGIIKIDQMVYDVKVVSLATEKSRDFSVITELWDLSYAKILYDPEGRIKEFIEDKLVKKKDISTLSGTMFAAWWHIKLACDIWINRKDVYQGHFMLNEAIKPLLQSLYQVNEVYVPHEKWLVHHLRDLKLPEPFEVFMSDLMKQGFDLEQLSERQEIFYNAWTWINARGKQVFNLNDLDDLTQVTIYEKLMAFIETGQVPAGFEHMDPFYLLADEVEGDLKLNQGQLEGLTLQDMYKWHYGVLSRVRAMIPKA